MTILNGTSGNDTLIGFAGDDTLKGGTGNDSLEGGTGNDFYTFARGDGADTISEYDLTADNSDTVQFLDVESTEITIVRQGYNLVLSYGADQLTITNYFFDADYSIELFKFSDGVTWDRAALLAQTFTFAGTNGSDHIDAYNGHSEGGNLIYGGSDWDWIWGGMMDDYIDGGEMNDQLSGESGNDTLNGGWGTDFLVEGPGNDLYTFAKGDGADTLWNSYGNNSTANNSDTVQFLDVQSTEITIVRQGNDLVLSYGTDDQLTVEDYFGDANYFIELFKFSDGVTWDRAALLAQNFTITGTAGHDLITSFASHNEGGNLIYGLDGNDTLFGGEMSDRISGGTGDDLLFGSTGNDTLNGGTGDDMLMGGIGDNLYTFARGEGADTISDYDPTAGNSDTVQFLDVESTEITVGRQKDNLVLSYGANQLTVANYFYNVTGYSIERFEFSDSVTWDRAALVAQNFTFTGTAGDDLINAYSHTEGDNLIYGLDGNDSLQGSKKNDRIDGGTGNDSLHGYAGNDLYTFAKGDGADSIVDYDWSAGNIDTVQFLDVKSTEITSIKHMEYDRLVLGYGDDQLTVTNYFSEMLYSIDLFKFSDGVTWDRAALLAQNFTFTGTAGNDLISSFSHSEGGNLIYGLGGNDTLTGGAMADSIDGGTGNDTLNGGAGADSMSGGDGSDAYFVDNAADKVIESNATASTGGTDTVYSKLGAYTLTDNVEKGRILASGTANLTGNSLNNTLYAGAGDNVLDGGLGTDLVSYYSATAGVTVSLATTALQATGGSGSDALKNVENLYGSNYADSLTGSTGNNALNAGAGNDILTGGLGADKLTGGTGADRFDFNSLAELGLSSTTRDTIADFKSSEGDRIDLLGVDANTALAGDQTFTFTGTSSAFTGDATAKLRFDAVNHILYGSTDADTAAEFAIALAGVSSLSAADFVL